MCESQKYRLEVCEDVFIAIIPPPDRPTVEMDHRRVGGVCPVPVRRPGGGAPVGDFEYEITDEDEVVITGYTGDDDEVDIPATIDGRPVTKIGEEAFMDQFGIYSVTIPPGVTEIGDRAFNWANFLQKVTIPNSVIRIGEAAFEYTQLWSVTIPESVTEMGPYAFANIALLGSVTLPGSLAEIPDYAFYECVGLKSVVIPEGVVRIGGVCVFVRPAPKRDFARHADRNRAGRLFLQFH